MGDTQKSFFKHLSKQNPQSPWFCRSDIIHFVARNHFILPQELLQEQRDLEVKSLFEAAKGGLMRLRL